MPYKLCNVKSCILSIDIRNIIHHNSCIIKSGGYQVLKNTGDKEASKRIQWHSAFVAALKLELKNYIEHLTFMTEYELTGRPKYVDLILLKKEEIGHEEGFVRLFSRYNVIEYKGIGDSLSVETVIKGIAYTCMYMTEPEPNDSSISKDDKSKFSDFTDVTLTFVRAAKPVKLLKDMKEQNCANVKEEKGVYTVNVTALFRVQIIVLREIDFEEHPWISSLTLKIDEDKARKLIEHEQNAETEWENRNVSEVIEAIIAANSQVFEEVKERNSDNMGKAMWNLMKPEIDAYVKEKVAENEAKMAEQMAEQKKLLYEKDRLLEKQEAEIKRLQSLLA